LLDQLENKAQPDLKGRKVKQAPEEKLVQKAIEASLELQGLLEQLAQQVQEG
jgi:hypothetical protein